MIDEILDRARTAARDAPLIGDEAYRAFPTAVARHVRDAWPRIAEANEQDLERGRERGLTESMLARMRLTDQVAAAVERLCERVAADVPDTDVVGEDRAGIGAARSHEVLRPLGVALIIYEARPVVTVESAVMGAATGNAVLLRGGKEIAATNRVLADVLADALAEVGLPRDLVVVLDSSDRSELKTLLGRDDAIDVLVPRGSPSLVAHCRATSRIPMIVGGGGVNHLFVHADADPELAAALALDGVLPDPAGCTALEMLLVDRPALGPFLDALDEAVQAGAVADDAELDDLRLRMSDEIAARLPAALSEYRDPTALGPHDDGREYLDRTLALRVVDGVDEAVDHVRRYGSGHTETVVSEDPVLTRRYASAVDAAAVVVNGSPRLHDAPSLGLGAELAISTGRVHVRGPVTLSALYIRARVVDGNRTTRFRPAPAVAASAAV